jgi:hypothetical protein
MSIRRVPKRSKLVIGLIVANTVAFASLASIAKGEPDEGRCNEETPCRCEFQGTKGGWCSRLGYGDSCTQNDACDATL